MRGTVQVGRALAIAALLTGGAALAQDAPDSAPPRGDGTCQALDDIAETLRRIRTDQRALVMIRLVELGDRRLEPLRNDVRSAQEESRNIGREIQQMAEMLTMMRQQREQESEAGGESASVLSDADLDQFEKMLELRREEQRAAELRAIEAENELARQRDRIADLDAKLDELLELLDQPD